MGLGLLIMAAFQIVMLFGFIVLWNKIKFQREEDPRLSRGLQILSSKLAVLEDLSQRTDVQVEQIQALIEKKSHELLQVISESEKQIQQITLAQNKSLEISKIFQDKIPHQEIIDRQMSMKYIQAAKMIAEGKTFEEIQSEVDLSFGELELISNVNIQRLLPQDQGGPQARLAAEEKFSPQERYEDTENGDRRNFQPAAGSHRGMVEATHQRPAPLAPIASVQGAVESKLKVLSDRFNQLPEITNGPGNSGNSSSGRAVRRYDFPQV